MLYQLQWFLLVPTLALRAKLTCSDFFSWFIEFFFFQQRQIIEQQEIRRQQKEAVEKEKARQEAERECRKQEDEALDRAMEQAKELQRYVTNVIFLYLFVIILWKIKCQWN